MTAPRKTDEASAPKRMSEEEFRITVRPLDQETPGQTMARRGRLLAEARRARSSEAALLARVERLEGLLRRVPQSECHPSEGQHSDLCKEIRAALSEKP